MWRFFARNYQQIWTFCCWEQFNRSSQSCSQNKYSSRFNSTPRRVLGRCGIWRRCENFFSTILTSATHVSEHDGPPEWIKRTGSERKCDQNLLWWFSVHLERLPPLGHRTLFADRGRSHDVRFVHLLQEGLRQCAYRLLHTTSKLKARSHCTCFMVMKQDQTGQWNTFKHHETDRWNTVKQNERMKQSSETPWNSMKQQWNSMKQNSETPWNRMKQQWNSMKQDTETPWNSMKQQWNSMKQHSETPWNSMKQQWNSMKQRNETLWYTMNQKSI